MEPQQTETTYDVIVVGAGPAGAVAARGLAAAGARTLLVDKAQFPRWKVCGCCLNGAALQTLASIGLGDVQQRLVGDRRLRRACFSAFGSSATVSLNAGIAVSREQLDCLLINEAVAAGADFQQETTAKWLGESDDRARVSLTTADGAVQASCRVVIAADGLAASFSRGVQGAQQHEANGSRIGAGATISGWPHGFQRDVIYMAIGAGGYVGLVGLEREQVANLAAAFDVDFVKSCGGLAHAAAAILDQSGLPPIDGIESARWHGTPLLTRSQSLPTSNRVLLVGDAASYVEPFTGEGMAWAIASGAAVVDYACATLEASSGDGQQQWMRARHDLLRHRMRHCRSIARALRYPRAVKLGIRLLGAFPVLARPYLRGLASA